MVLCVCVTIAVNSQETFVVQLVPLTFNLYPSSSSIKYNHEGFW